MQSRMKARVQERLNDGKPGSPGSASKPPPRPASASRPEPPPEANKQAAPANAKQKQAPAQPANNKPTKLDLEAAAGSQAAEANAVGARARMERSYSVRSQETVDTLQQIELELNSMKLQADDAEGVLKDPPSDGLPPQLRNTLAQLHGDANKLLATRIDAILTSDLSIGKDDARAKRKQLIGVTEGLIDRLEGQVKLFDKLKKG